MKSEGKPSYLPAPLALVWSRNLTDSFSPHPLPRDGHGDEGKERELN